MVLQCLMSQFAFLTWIRSGLGQKLLHNQISNDLTRDTNQRNMMLWGLVVLARQGRNVHHAVAGRTPAAPHSGRLTFIVEMLNPDWPQTSNVLHSGRHRYSKVSVSSLITQIQTQTVFERGREEPAETEVSRRKKKKKEGLACRAGMDYVTQP